MRAIALRFGRTLRRHQTLKCVRELNANAHQLENRFVSGLSCAFREIRIATAFTKRRTRTPMRLLTTLSERRLFSLRVLMTKTKQLLVAFDIRSNFADSNRSECFCPLNQQHYEATFSSTGYRSAADKQLGKRNLN